MIEMTQEEFIEKIRQTKQWPTFIQWYMAQMAFVNSRGQFIKQPINGQIGWFADFLRYESSKEMNEVLTIYGALGKHAVREVILKAFDTYE